MIGLLWLIAAVLLILWLIGFSVNWGAFIWILLIIAAVVLLINLIAAVSRGRWY